jgi:beta-glucosidase-like glycosyl hydrolase
MVPDIQTLSLDQKIGQLFAIPVSLSSPQSKLNKICEIINQYHIGCIVFDRMGTIKQQAAIVNHLKQNCVMAPIIAQDLEHGLCMRLYDGVRFPKAITCGAIQDNNLIYQMAQEIGRECKLLGVNINLAPVVDIITNENSFMKERSYGQDRNNVLQKATAFVRGLLSQGVYPCLKHFPGIGDADASSDPHLALPVVPHDKKTFAERELYPFE